MTPVWGEGFSTPRRYRQQQKQHRRPRGHLEGLCRHWRSVAATVVSGAAFCMARNAKMFSRFSFCVWNGSSADACRTSSAFAQPRTIPRPGTAGSPAAMSRDEGPPEAINMPEKRCASASRPQGFAHVLFCAALTCSQKLVARKVSKRWGEHGRKVPCHQAPRESRQRRAHLLCSVPVSLSSLPLVLSPVERQECAPRQQLEGLRSFRTVCITYIQPTLRSPRTHCYYGVPVDPLSTRCGSL